MPGAALTDRPLRSPQRSPFQRSRTLVRPKSHPFQNFELGQRLCTHERNLRRTRQANRTPEPKTREHQQSMPLRASATSIGGQERLHAHAVEAPPASRRLLDATRSTISERDTPRTATLLVRMAADSVSERLRRWTRNSLGSARRGSNPLAVVLLRSTRAEQTEEKFLIHSPHADVERFGTTCFSQRSE